MNAYLASQSSLSFSFHSHHSMSMPEPPSSMPSSRSCSSPYNPYDQSTYHNRDLALQTYLALHSQHESLVQHLDELRPSTCSHRGSPSTSPTRSMSSHHGRSSPLPRQRQRSSGFGPGSGSSSSLTSSLAGSAMLGVDDTDHDHDHDQTTLAEVALEEAKLCDVNEGIKRTLTELLNCEATRGEGNRQFRSWVQGRLMEAERELRQGRGRRRRSAGSACSE
ncbi:hypothetical protein QBC32DRAFT_8395 [Pseudoneurospora amorphoporcata]|uniref:Uncharacterized protein n=1 Tax=Pseudoneurospora amorphoporcata TaxID=241081 RepID=A0AAN6NT93_9PEZI|nr:hypothetical protein QBC32DRAFT_8395 [Pseudoneurospora amorphoporcata]